MEKKNKKTKEKTIEEFASEIYVLLLQDFHVKKDPH